MRHDQIAHRLFNTPLLVDPTKAAAIVYGLGPRLVGGEIVLRNAVEADTAAEAAGRIGPRASILGDEAAERRRGYGEALYAVQGGVARIDVVGSLVHRGAWIGRSSGVTSYEGIAAQVAAAAEDPAVRGIALEIDSFGGEVSGVFDLADQLRAARGRKPVWAFVAESALSAGYALASQADRIVLPRTGAVGSIGVVVMHADWSQALADGGVAVTLIHAGAHKVDGNPYEPLPAGVRAELQRDVEQLRGLFAQTVARGRAGALSAEAALATEAQVYRGAAAVEAGLADEVADLRAAFAGFVAAVQGRGAVPVTLPAASGVAEEPEMARNDQKPTAETADETTGQPPAAPVDEETREDAAPAEASAPRLAATIGAEHAAEIVAVCEQARALGVTMDAAQHIREAANPAALRAAVLDQLAAQASARDVSGIAPPARQSAGQSVHVDDRGRAQVSGGTTRESALVARARREAEAQRPAH